ncbi:MAG: molybdenum cofactor cytidylyltransferase [Syntrophaceae bacterium]|nr:molybdenum cofactor cytidylyltransferase [Syntrophaceae bacterium]
MSGVSAILLAAGESRRMGVDKLSLPWGKKTIFEHCLDTLLRSKVREVIVVLKDRREGRRKDFKDRRVKVVINPEYRKGMSTSIRKGILAVDPRSHGILIALGDQPLLRTRTINALIDAFARRGKGIVVPSFRGKRGHPVIFHRDFERELRRLRGDVGGRSIIERYSEEVWTLPVKSEGVVKDIDTRKDYEGANDEQ